MLKEKLTWRYATKAMDPAKAVPQAKVNAILEAANLAPTSSGLQPFEIIVVTNPEVKAKLSAAAYGQKQLVDGSHVLVFAAWDNYTAERIDAVVNQTHVERGTPMEMLNAYYDGLKAQYLPRAAEVNYEHAARQAYIGLGSALLAAAEQGIDATPMEGFEPEKVDQILNLAELGLKSVLLLPLGYREVEGDWLVNLKKVRRSKADFIIER